MRFSSSLFFRLLSITFIPAIIMSACTPNRVLNKGNKQDADRQIYRDIAAQTKINPYLWRATLETLSFLPLNQINAKAGIILSDWYIEPQYPNERFKVTAYILDHRLRADALKVIVNRQVFKDGQWQNAKTDGDTPYKLENTILSKAKILKTNSYKK